jgi:hypothetical protein
MPSKSKKKVDTPPSSSSEDESESENESSSSSSSEAEKSGSGSSSSAADSPSDDEPAEKHKPKSKPDLKKGEKSVTKMSKKDEKKAAPAESSSSSSDDEKDSSSEEASDDGKKKAKGGKDAKKDGKKDGKKEAPAQPTGPPTPRDVAKTEFAKGVAMCKEHGLEKNMKSLAKATGQELLDGVFKLIADPPKKKKSVAIKEEKPELLIGLLMVLRYASEGQDEAFTKLVREKDFYAQVINMLMENETSGVRRMSVRFVGDGVLKCEHEPDNLANALFYAQNNTVPAVGSLVKQAQNGSSDDAQVRESFRIALGTIRILGKLDFLARAQKGVSFTDMVREEQVFPAVVTLMKSREVDMVSLAASCVRALCHHRPDVQEEFISLGAFTQLFNLVFDVPPHQRPNIEHISSLSALCMTELGRSEFTKGNGFERLAGLVGPESVKQSSTLMTQIFDLVRSLCAHRAPDMQGAVAKHGLLALAVQMIVGDKKASGSKGGKKDKKKEKAAPALPFEERNARAQLLRSALTAMSECVAANLTLTTNVIKDGALDKCVSLIHGEDEGNSAEKDKAKAGQVQDMAWMVQGYAMYALSCLLMCGEDVRKKVKSATVDAIIAGMEVAALQEHAGRCLIELFNDDTLRREKGPALVERLLDIADKGPSGSQESALSILSILIKDQSTKSIVMKNNRTNTVIQKVLNSQGVESRSIIQVCKCVNYIIAAGPNKSDAKYQSAYASACGKSLVSLLEKSNVKVKQHISYTMWMIVKNSKPAVQNVFIEAGVMEQLIAILEEKTTASNLDSLREYSTGTLTALIQKNKDAKTKLSQVKNAFKILTDMLAEEHSPKLRSTAAKILWFACDANADNQKAVLKAKTHVALGKGLVCDVAEDQAASLAQSCAAALWTLAKAPGNGKTLASDKDLPSQIAAALEFLGPKVAKEGKTKSDTREAGAVQYVAKLVSALAADKENGAKAVSALVEAYVVEGLEHTRNCTNKTAKKESVTALKHLGCKKPGQVTGPAKKKGKSGKGEKGSSKADKADKGAAKGGKGDSKKSDSKKGDKGESKKGGKGDDKPAKGGKSESKPKPSKKKAESSSSDEPESESESEKKSSSEKESSSSEEAAKESSKDESSAESSSSGDGSSSDDESSSD